MNSDANTPSPSSTAPRGGPAGWQVWLRNGLTAVFIMYAFSQVTGLSTPLDLMMLSGSAVAVAGLWLGIGVRLRMHEAIDRLKFNGVLLLTPAQLGALHDELDASAARQGLIGAAVTMAAEIAVVVSGSVLVPWLVYGIPPVSSSPSGSVLGVIDSGTFVGLLVIAAIAGAGIGWYLGQFAGYGRLPALITRAGGRLRGYAEAADGVGGLQPLVGFVWRQATLSLLPLLWIGLWLILTSFEPWSEQYGFWRFPFFLLSILALIFALQGFFAPARMLKRLFDQQMLAAGVDDRSTEVIGAARRKAGPATATFLVLLAIWLLTILTAGAAAWSRGGLSSFLFGPPP